MPRSDRHLANKITLTRILGVGLIFWFTPFTTNYLALWVILIYILVSMTDFLDGWIARRMKIESDLGKVLDPLADKILVLCFLPLLQMQVIPAFPVFVILAREFSIMALRVMSAKNGTIVPANVWGKWKTAITFPLCGILFGRVPVQEVEALPWVLVPLEYARQWVISWPQYVIDGLIWLAVIVTLISFWTYLRDYLWQFNLEKSDGNKDEAKKHLYQWVPTGFTMVNLLCGVGAVLTALGNHIALSSALIMIGMFMDGLDGKVARYLGVHSDAGAKWDSRADFISFGVAPAVILLTYFIHLSFPYSWLLGVALGLGYYAAVHFRLRRFNAGGHGDFFEGFPSPAGAALCFLPAVSPVLSSNVWVVVGFALASGLLMVSTIPFPHNDHALRHTPLKWTKWPNLVLFFGTIIYLFNVPIINTWPLPSLLLVAMVPYVLYPMWGKTP